MSKQQKIKIGIIGLGFVGSAVAASYANSDVELLICDPAKEGTVSIDQLMVTLTDASFVCVPTPANKDGSCDVSILDGVLTKLFDGNYSGTIISKCTAPPEFYDKWSYKLSNLVYSPELLRAKYAIEDYLNPEMVIVGGNTGDCKVAVQMMQQSSITFDFSKVIHTDIRTASTFKYAANSFLAMKVVFANQLKKYANISGSDWQMLNTMLQSDTRLGRTHWDVPGHDGEFGYGGACFPKDVAALINSASTVGSPFTLLEKVQEVNGELRKNILK